MGNKYNRFNPQKIPQKNMFLPMLCSKPAIKDGRPPRSDRERSESFSGDPLSPRIGCMGQVKRNNRVAGLPFSHRILITTKNAVLNKKDGNTPNVGYLKLKKFFSSKNLLASPAAGTVAGTNRSAAASISTAGVTGCESRRRLGPDCAISGKKKGVNCAISGKKKGVCENGNLDSFSVVDLDPPLPVVRRVKAAAEALSLQLQSAHAKIDLLQQEFTKVRLNETALDSKLKTASHGKRVRGDDGEIGMESVQDMDTNERILRVNKRSRSTTTQPEDGGSVFKDDEDNSQQTNQDDYTKFTVQKLKQELTKHNFGAELLQLKNPNKRDILGLYEKCVLKL